MSNRSTSHHNKSGLSDARRHPQSDERNSSRVEPKLVESSRVRSGRVGSSRVGRIKSGRFGSIDSIRFDSAILNPRRAAHAVSCRLLRWRYPAAYFGTNHIVATPSGLRSCGSFCAPGFGSGSGLGSGFGSGFGFGFGSGFGLAVSSFNLRTSASTFSAGVPMNRLCTPTGRAQPQRA